MPRPSPGKAPHRPPARDRPRVGWVFAGGGARGAYEVGVCSYLFDRVARDLGRPLPLDIVSGTSAGAIQASALAVWADDPRGAMDQLARRWTALSLKDVLLCDRRRAFNMIRALFGRPPRRLSEEAARGGVLDPRPLERLLSAELDFRRIDAHIAGGRLTAVSLSATHLASGATAVFCQRSAAHPPLRSHNRARFLDVKLTATHALASAAIPFLFPSVRTDGELYCDGSLRQHVPLSPARQLGATALVVVNPRSGAPVATAAPEAASASNGDAESAAAAPKEPFPGPLFLLGKTLNALTFDRIDGDLAHLDGMNRLLAAGTRRFGASFVAELNRALAEEGAAQVKPLSLLHIHPSESIGRLSADFVRSPRFRGRRRGFLERTLVRLADSEGESEADLLSYLLFDGRFARQLIDLGWQDTERRHDEIAAFFDALLDGRQPPRPPQSLDA